jgi:hypothetical protein
LHGRPQGKSGAFVCRDSPGNQNAKPIINPAIYLPPNIQNKEKTMNSHKAALVPKIIASHPNDSYDDLNQTLALQRVFKTRDEMPE